MSSAVLDRSARKPRKRKGEPASTDPVTRYALAVVAREILTGRAVRLACERHLRDLERQRSDGFPFYFDAAGGAQHIIDFFPAFLTLENGNPFVLVDWQAFVEGSVFGWKRVIDGGRKYQTAYVETGKGSGKTPMLAGSGLYGITFDGEQSAEVYSAAFDKDQASITLNDAIRMTEASEDLLGMLEVGKYNLANESTGSFFRALSSEHRSKSGPRPHMGLIDEVHEHRDGTIINKVRAGFKGRRQPLLFEITNSGHDRTSICWQHHQHSMEVLEQRIVDEQWFAYICQLDPCDACFEDGFRQPKEGCPDCDDWTDEAVWMKANPSLGVTIQPEYLRTQVDLAIAMPSDQALVKRLNFCLWTETHQVWISPDRWNACKVENVSTSNDQKLVCAAGLDPSSIHDLTAFVVALRHDDQPTGDDPIAVEIEGKSESGEHIKLVYNLNFHVELVPFFWLPKDTLNARVQKERIQYDVWARTPSPERPYIFATKGPSIDHNAVFDFVIHDAWKRFKIQKLGMDQNSGLMLFQKLRDDGRLGDKVESVGQGKKLSEAFKFIEILIAHRRLWHDGNPVLSLCFANAEPQRDRLGALWIEKPSQEKVIDGAVATAMAIKQLMGLPFRKKSYSMHFLGGIRA